MHHQSPDRKAGKPGRWRREWWYPFWRHVPHFLLFRQTGEANCSQGRKKCSRRIKQNLILLGKIHPLTLCSSLPSCWTPAHEAWEIVISLVDSFLAEYAHWSRDWSETTARRWSRGTKNRWEIERERGVGLELSSSIVVFLMTWFVSHGMIVPLTHTHTRSHPSVSRLPYSFRGLAQRLIQNAQRIPWRNENSLRFFFLLNICLIWPERRSHFRWGWVRMAGSSLCVRAWIS